MSGPEMVRGSGEEADAKLPAGPTALRQHPLCHCLSQTAIYQGAFRDRQENGVRTLETMNRRELLLAVLACSDGRPYSPVQIQKAIFLVTENVPGLVTEGPGFAFDAYDYGPFDSSVYTEALALRADGDAVIAPSDIGRWNTYAASDAGLERGREILDAMDEQTREYLRRVSAWVRSQSFSSLVKSIYDAYPHMRANSIFRG